MKPVHAVAVVEEFDDATCAVNDKPMKHSVQVLNKCRIVFVQMNKICGFIWPNAVALSSQSLHLRGIRVLFAREEQVNILPFIADRHAIRKGSLQRCPADIHTQSLVHPHTAAVKTFMLNSLDHFGQLHPCARTRMLSYEANQSWHYLSSLQRLWNSCV